MVKAYPSPVCDKIMVIIKKKVFQVLWNNVPIIKVSAFGTHERSWHFTKGWFLPDMEGRLLSKNADYLKWELSYSVNRRQSPLSGSLLFCSFSRVSRSGFHFSQGISGFSHAGTLEE